MQRVCDRFGESVRTFGDGSLVTSEPYIFQADEVEHEFQTFVRETCRERPVDDRVEWFHVNGFGVDLSGGIDFRPDVSQLVYRTELNQKCIGSVFRVKFEQFVVFVAVPAVKRIRIIDDIRGAGGYVNR